MKKLQLSSTAIAIIIATSVNANDEINKNDIETIEVKGNYLKGYSAHRASGASRLALDIIDIPQSVSVITETQMSDYQLNDIDTVLDLSLIHI